MVLPLFPLQLVVYPEERLALHIFEERYQQLIMNCENDNLTFGVPTFINNSMDYGTEVCLKKVVKRYPKGECDVICTGVRVFRLKKFFGKLPDCLYAGGEVAFMDNQQAADRMLQEKLLESIHLFYRVLDIDHPPYFELPLTSYQVAHKVGLSLDQEYHVLKLQEEKERLLYIIKHLAVTIPIMEQMNRTKKVIKLNGHFKNFDPLNFEGLDI